MRNRHDETYAQRAIGLIFAILGAALALIAVILNAVVYDGIRLSPLLWNDAVFIVCFVLFIDGGAFFLLGMAFRLWAHWRRRRIRQLIDEGERITAEIDEIAPNMRIRVNNRFPYILLCSWYDKRADVTYHFRSGNVWSNPAKLLEERGTKTVTVYIDHNNMRKYYVEVPGYGERDVYL